MATVKPPQKPGVIPAPATARPSPKADAVPPAPRIEPPAPSLGRDPAPSALPTGREGIGDEALDPDRLAGLSPALLAEHLMILLANKRAKMDRSAVLDEVGALVLSLSDPDFVRKTLFLMPQVGRIVDVYPLELLAWVLEREPGHVARVRFERFIQNREALEAGVFEVEAPISIRIPLAMRVRDFALEGGGTPGYCLQPGALAEYLLEMGDEGVFELMIRGEIRKQSLIDRVRLKVVDPGPGSA